MASSGLDIPTIDLFAGAGGLGLGAADAGADLRLSIDSDTPSCETLEANAGPGHTIMEADVGEMTGQTFAQRLVSRSDPLLVVGGAPCQPFSKAAYWTDEGREARYRGRERGREPVDPSPADPPVRTRGATLVEEYWRLVVKSQEQTRSCSRTFEASSTPAHRVIVERLTDAARQRAFKTTGVLANAVEHGVPQKRKRVFVMGSKGSARGPEPTHRTTPDKAAELPPAGDGRRGASARSQATRLLRAGGGRRRALGGAPADGPAWLELQGTHGVGRSPEPDVRDGDAVLELPPQAQPRPAVVDDRREPGPWTGPFHWDSRRLRTPELAALQTFPEGYEFAGTRRERVRQIGNAVPAPTGRADGRASLPATS